jgi:hypothetical protein
MKTSNKVRLAKNQYSYQYKTKNCLTGDFDTDSLNTIYFVIKKLTTTPIKKEIASDKRIIIKRKPEHIIVGRSRKLCLTGKKQQYQPKNQSRPKIQTGLPGY